MDKFQAFLQALQARLPDCQIKTIQNMFGVDVLLIDGEGKLDKYHVFNDNGHMSFIRYYNGV